MHKQNVITLTPDSETSEYERFLSHCFGLQDSNAKGKGSGRVAIVGAGMAGLTAAWVLQRCGHEVKMFEASNRVGGRIRTLRDHFTPGLYVEAGAMRVPSVHKLTRQLIKKFRLKTLPFKDDDEHPWVYVNGQWAKMRDYLHGKATFAQGRVGSKLLEVCTKPLSRLAKDDKKRDLLTKISLGEYLRCFMRGGINPITEEPIDEASRLSSADFELILLEESRANMDASVIEVLRDHEAHVDANKVQIQGGMDKLPNAFCDKKFIEPGSIFFNARVRRISREGTTFSIEYENTTTHQEHREGAFNRIILAAPFSSLCHVKIPVFENTYGYHKLRAIRSLHYENATKIALEFSHQFWKHDQIEGGRSITDLPVRWVHYPTPDQFEGPHGILLASYTWGEDSLRWSALTKEARVRYAHANIQELHKDALVHAKYRDTQLVAGMSYSWAEDSYSLGAFAIFPPHQEELFADMWKQYAGIHFAGEHTSLRHAWIEGAVESGLRAAQEVNIALTRD